MLLSLMMLSGSAMAQLPDGQESRAMRPKRVRMTQEQMTEKSPYVPTDGREQAIRPHSMPSANSWKAPSLWVNGKEMNIQ